MRRRGRTRHLGEFYPEAVWQRCVVHWYRDVLTVVPNHRKKVVVAMLKAIHAQEDRQAAEKKAEDIQRKLGEMKLGKAASVVKDGVLETLSFQKVQTTTRCQDFSRGKKKSPPRKREELLKNPAIPTFALLALSSARKA